MTDSEKFQKLLEAVPDADRLDLEIQQGAVETTRSAYKETPSAGNKKDWDAAREGLQETIDRLWSACMEQGRRFKDRKAVLEWLNDNGYSISQGKLYAAAKKGLLKLQPDKSVLMSSVEAYIRNPESGLVKHAEVGQEIEDKEKAQRKLDLDLSILERKDERQQFEYDQLKGKYIPRDEFELELAGRAAVLETGFKYRIKSRVGEWIQICGGSQDKRAELLAHILDEVDAQLNEFATTDKFQVMFLAEEDPA